MTKFALLLRKLLRQAKEAGIKFDDSEERPLEEIEKIINQN